MNRRQSDNNWRRNGNQTTSITPSVVDSGRSSASNSTSLYQDDDDNEENSTSNIRIRRNFAVAHKCYEQAYVSHVDHPSGFFIQLASSNDRFPPLHTEINRFYSENSMIDNEPSTSTWQQGDYCVAKFKDDRAFYRSRIVEVKRNRENHCIISCTVIFLDFGNTDEVPFADIHRLTPDFARLPAQAIPCSLTQVLPVNGTWLDHPRAINLFRELVLDKFVDATFIAKSSRDFWQMSFVDLQISSSKINVGQRLILDGLARKVTNEQIGIEFNQLLNRTDYIVYSIPYEGENVDNDDDEL